jgi:hypothetical protein
MEAGFRVQGSGVQRFRGSEVQGLRGSGVQGSGVQRFRGSGFRVQGLGKSRQISIKIAFPKMARL